AVLIRGSESVKTPSMSKTTARILERIIQLVMNLRLCHPPITRAKCAEWSPILRSRAKPQDPNGFASPQRAHLQAARSPLRCCPTIAPPVYPPPPPNEIFLSRVQ